MDVVIEKIPGGFRVDGLELKNGKCGCTTVLPCCYSWSKVKRNGNELRFTAKLSSPDTQKVFTWGYTVRKGDTAVDVSVEDASDKIIFSGYYPPPLTDWTARNWTIVKQEGEQQDFDVWRCSACKWLYKSAVQPSIFESLGDEWKCPVCNSSRNIFEKIG